MEYCPRLPFFGVDARFVYRPLVALVFFNIRHTKPLRARLLVRRLSLSVMKGNEFLDEIGVFYFCSRMYTRMLWEWHPATIDRGWKPLPQEWLWREAVSHSNEAVGMLCPEGYLSNMRIAGRNRLSLT